MNPVKRLVTSNLLSNSFALRVGKHGIVKTPGEGPIDIFHILSDANFLPFWRLGGGGAV